MPSPHSPVAADDAAMADNVAKVYTGPERRLSRGKRGGHTVLPQLPNATGSPVGNGGYLEEGGECIREVASGRKIRRRQRSSRGGGGRIGGDAEESLEERSEGLDSEMSRQTTLQAMSPLASDDSTSDSGRGRTVRGPSGVRGSPKRLS